MVKRGDLEYQAYSAIKNAIVTGVYPPGAQIVEDLVAKKLNMSRSPVRIAIKRLQAEGFLERRENKRIYVVFANEKRTLDALYIREALEGMSARLAAKNRAPADIQQLQEMLTRMDTMIHTDRIYDVYLIGVEMHKQIFYMSKNDQLAHIGINALEQEAVFSYRSLRQSPERVLRAHHEHTLIATHVIEGNADSAEDAARQHVHRVIERYLELKITTPQQALISP